MTDAELLRFGQDNRYMCSPYANLGKPPLEAVVIQLREARAEWSPSCLALETRMRGRSSSKHFAHSTQIAVIGISFKQIRSCVRASDFRNRTRKTWWSG